MLYRIVGIVLFVVSALYLGIGVIGLLRTNQMAALLAEISRANQSPLDQADWAQHWRAGGLFMALTGTAGVVSAVGMLFRRKWSFPLWAGLATVMFGSELYTFTFGRATYAFEAVEPAELAILFVLMLASWFAVWRVRTVARAQVSAS